MFRHTHAYSHMHTYIHKLTLHTYTCTTFIHSNTFTHTCTLTMYTYTHVHTLAPQAKPQTCSYTRSHMQTHTCTHMREHISTLTLYHTCERWVLSRAFGCGMVRDQRVRSTEKLRHQSWIWGYTYPHVWWLFLRRGLYFCNIWPVSSLLREDGEIWQIGNLERTNQCDPLSLSMISSLGAIRGHELRRYRRAGPGGKLPWSRPLWQEFSLGKFTCSQMQAASSISASERWGSLLLYRFVPPLAQVRQERRILSFGIPNRMIHHLSALTMSLQIPIREGGGENLLLLSTSVSTSCLWCIPVRHPCKYLSCVFIYDNSMTYDPYLMLFGFPRA